MKGWAILWMLVPQKDVIWQDLAAISFLMRGEFPLWSNTKPRVCLVFFFFWELHDTYMIPQAGLYRMCNLNQIRPDGNQCPPGEGIHGARRSGTTQTMVASSDYRRTGRLWAALFVFTSGSVWLKPSLSLIRMWLCESTEGISKTASYRCHVSSPNFPFLLATQQRSSPIRREEGLGSGLVFVWMRAEEPLT